MNSLTKFSKRFKDFVYSSSAAFVGGWIGTLFVVQVSLGAHKDAEKPIDSVLRSSLERLNDFTPAFVAAFVLVGAAYIFHSYSVKLDKSIPVEVKSDIFGDIRYEFISWLVALLVGAVISSYLSAETVTVGLIRQMVVVGIFSICAMFAAFFVYLLRNAFK